MDKNPSFFVPGVIEKDTPKFIKLNFKWLIPATKNSYRVQLIP